MNRFVSYLRGYVRLEIHGKGIEKFINLANRKGIQFWNIRLLDFQVLEIYAQLPHFFKLRPILRGTGCRLRVKERFGIPFFLDRLGKRKFFAVGIVGFVAGIYLLSSVVWSIKVEGNEKLKTADILQAAQQQGLRVHQWKWRLKDPDTMSKELHGKLPGTAWVGVQVRGTQLIIKVVESRLPEDRPLMNPRHLVASKNALVTQIIAEKGKPMVRPNTYVRKGDILISGIIGDEANSSTVVSQGTVKGLVWYSPKIEVPLTQKYKVYTGETYEKKYIVFGQRALQLTGYRKPVFEQKEVIADRKSVSWRDFVLPVGWLNEKIMEVRMEENPLTLAEAKANGLEQARSEIVAAAGKEARVTSEKILHEKAENGKVYMEALFEVEELIAQEQPIIQ